MFETTNQVIYKLQQYHEYTKKISSHTDQNVKGLGLHLINYLVSPEYRRLYKFRKHLQQMEVVMVTWRTLEAPSWFWISMACIYSHQVFQAKSKVQHQIWQLSAAQHRHYSTEVSRVAKQALQFLILWEGHWDQRQPGGPKNIDQVVGKINSRLQ